MSRSSDSGSSAGGSAADLQSGDSVSQEDTSDASAGREVVTSGSVRITTADPSTAGDKAVAIVEGAGGRIDSRIENAPTDSDNGSASLQLRIPAAKLTPTLDALKKLGSVDSVEISTNDVTTEGQDLDARITALDASVTRLVKLLATAKDTKVLIELETAVSERQGELESLRSQRRYLSDQVAMSSISFDIVSTADAPLSNPATFGDAFVAGLAGFGAFFATLLLAVGYLLPWLVLAAAIAVVVVLVTRSRRKKNLSKKRMPEGATAE